MTVILDVPYSGALKMDIATGPVASAPCLVLVHGGGWFGGDKADLHALGQQANAAGWAVFDINYTLVGGAPQTAIYDVRTAVHWVRAHAVLYSGDPTRVAALGCSAGGHLTLMAAAQGKVGDDRPNAVASWSGPTRGETLPVTAWNGNPDYQRAVDYCGCDWTALGCDTPITCCQVWKDAFPHWSIKARTCAVGQWFAETDAVPSSQGTDLDGVLATISGQVHQLTVLAGVTAHAQALSPFAWAPTDAFLRANF